MARDPSKPPSAGDESTSSTHPSFLRAIARASAGMPAAILPDPTQLAHFRIVGRLGAGGMGVVYKAVDEKLGRSVALKVLPSALEADPARRRRFLREARSAAAITHPNIATVYEIGEADGRIFIAMELVEGETLRARIGRGRLPLDEGVRMARQLLDALASAHDKGVVHCDLKPDNVMIDARGHVKVLDFGLAKLREPEPGSESPAELGVAETSLSPSDEGHVIGTPGYMAPEQADGRAPDSRADLFAFGVVLYEMLAGVRPFTGKTVIALLVAVDRDPHVPLRKHRPDVSRELEDVVDRCLAKARDERHSSAKEVLEALTSAHESAPWAFPRSRARALLLAGGIVPVAIAIVLGARGLLTEGPGASSSAASSIAVPAASATAIGLLDSPPPVTKSPEAAAAYKRALTDVRDGVRPPWTSLAHAVELDPEFAAAQLRLAMVLLPPVSTKRYAEAVRFRTNLDGRDLEILHAEEPVGAGAPPDLVEAEKRYAELHAKRPGDVEVLMRLAAIRERHDPESARATFAELLALAPNMAGAELAAGAEAEATGEPDAATAHYQRCVDLSPTAARCRAHLARQVAAQGRCDEYAKQVTRILVLEPDDLSFRRDGLSAALTTGASDVDVHAATDGVLRLISSSQKAFYRELLDGESALWRGSMVAARDAFTRAEGHSRELGVTTPLPWTFPQRLRIAEELGDVDGVRTLVRSYVGARALTTETAFDDVALSAIARHRVLSHGELLALRDRWRKDAIDASPAAVWLGYEAGLALDEEEARSALASQPDAPLDPYALDSNVQLGHVLLLARRFADASSRLALAATNCSLFQGDYSYVPWVIPAAYELGLARESLGDAKGACSAYRRVVDGWGNASPRSTTAEAARTRIDALRCSDK